MKIAIISDIHNNITNLEKVLNYCRDNNIKKIICCGDLASMETLDFLNDNFSGEIYYCFGNMDDGQLKNYDFDKKYKNTWIFKDYGEIEIENNPIKPGGHGARKIAFTHYTETAKELCQTGKYDFVFYGHTHKPWEEIINNCKMLNPGNVAGEIYPPTFAVWNTDNDKFELIRIHDLN
ncbi:MAG: YfcE family phosphodiesterase [Candidatus Moranbacteria bacterium]|nr:YfcE family phosphodiesterase [Candidatus Moranbacteria bacterium]